MPRDAHEPVYVISVAAKLLQCHPQTLRLYEREGLLEPKRSPQHTRLYSEADLERVRQIQRLTQDMGVNIAGVEVVLDLLGQIRELQEQVARLQSEEARRTALVPVEPLSGKRRGRRTKIVEIEG